MSTPQTAADLRYPIGKPNYTGPLTENQRREYIHAIADTPANLRAAVKGLTESQLDTPYREGGWTVRQVVHHLPDSHINSYVRFRWALTEASPTIKAYDEGLWANLPDAKSAPIDLSLDLLESLHSRWVILLKSLSDDDWKRNFVHPQLGPVPLDKNLVIYAWHGRHHVAHITGL